MKTKTKLKRKQNAKKSLRNLVKDVEEEKSSFEEAMDKVWNPKRLKGNSV